MEKKSTDHKVEGAGENWVETEGTDIGATTESDNVGSERKAMPLEVVPPKVEEAVVHKVGDAREDAPNMAPTCVDPTPPTATDVNGDFEADIEPIPAGAGGRPAPPQQRPGAYLHGGVLRGTDGLRLVAGQLSRVDQDSNSDMEQYVDRNSRQQQGPTATTGQPGNEGLALASLVEENEDLPTATPVDHSSLTKRNTDAKGKFLAALACVFLILVVAISISVSVTKQANDIPTPNNISNASHHDEEEPQATVVPTQAPTDFVLLFTGMENSTIDAIQSDPFSPQFKAHEWLKRHPDFLTFPDWRKRQLFALATLFYAIGVEAWHKLPRENILQYEISECDWYSGIYSSMIYSYELGDWTMVQTNTNQSTCNSQGEFVTLFINRYGFIEEHADTPDELDDIMNNIHIPPEIALLTSLEEFKLWFMQFDRDIEEVIIPEFKRLTNLKALNFHVNGLLGDLDPIFFQERLPLSSLTRLDIMETPSSFGGTVPSKELGLLSNLEILKLRGNFSGSIPTEVGHLSNLEYFDIYSSPTALAG